MYPAFDWSVAPGHHVWSGRALQENFVELVVWSCINVSGL
jgi:hypothetical protein